MDVLKPKICFIGNLQSSFGKADYEILARHFRVRCIEPPKRLGSWPRFITRIAYLVRDTDVAFSWFAGMHSAFAMLFAKLFRKKSVIVAGGYDVAYVPLIGYGAFTNIKEKIPAQYVLRTADVVISVSKSNQRELLEKAQPKRNVLIYNGVSETEFAPGGGLKEKLVLTVCTINRSNLARKGLETLTSIAWLLPEVRFVVVGRYADRAIIEYLKLRAPENVQFTGFVPDSELLRWYQRAKVYAQLSVHEGFGIALAEAMLCGCIPVVTNRFALPEIVGDVGFYTSYNDAIRTAAAIREALNAPDVLGELARKRICEYYTLNNREQQLVRLLQELT
jgi:glycosyltransferase involved in cell wall biosynthesis